MLDAVPDALLGVDSEGTVVWANPAAERLWGWSRAALAGRPATILAPERHRPEVFEAARLKMTGRLDDSTPMMATGLRRDGTEFAAEVLLRRVDGDEIAMVASVRDVSSRRRRVAQATWLAYHDELTRLPNRRMLIEELDMELARSRAEGLGVALLSIDLDSFKAVNDGFGHAVGDTVLRQVAARLRALTRSGEVLARYGGDEFLLMIRRTPPGSADAALRASEQVRAILAEPLDVDGTELRLDATVGISLFPRDGEDAGEMLQNAVAALNRGKERGPGSTSTFDQLRPGSRDRLAQVAEMHRAIEEGQLIPRYQPIVHLDTGSVYGFEALMRWRHPQRGELAAGSFIEAADASGLLNRMGEMIYEMALQDLRGWREAGLDLDVGVNLAPSQIAVPGFPDHFLAQIEATGVEPGRVLVEITESALQARDGVGLENLELLEAEGVMLAIDDFGAEYSSLARLRDLRVHRLKVDRSFIRDLPDDDSAMAVAKAILDLARALGVRVVAEGVETEEQRQALLDLGYERAQGFLFCRPVLADEVPEVLARGTPHPYRVG